MSQNGSVPLPRGVLQPMVDPFQDWETMLESGQLDSSLRNLDLSKPPPPIVMVEEEGRTPYRPPEPKLKILKRPEVANNSSRGQEVKPRTEQKSLRQREQEYAEARQRILGSSEGEGDSTTTREGTKQPPLNQVKAVVRNSASRGSTTTRLEVLCPPGQPPPPHPPLSRGVAPYSSQRQYRAPPPVHVHCFPPPPLVDVGVGRHPRVPTTSDGSRGFPGKR